MSARGPALTIDPPPARWAALSLSTPAASAGPHAGAYRAELGLPAAGPLVISGHQASLWHAGILSKMLAAGAFAGAINGAAAWIVVDQDECEFTPIRVPVRDRAGGLRIHEWRVTEPPRHGVAAASVSAFDPRPLDTNDTPALPCVAEGVEAIRSALARRRSEASAARQVALATADLAATIAPAPALIYASDLARTDVFRRMAERLRADAAGAVRAYNEAVREHPEARLTPLREEASGRRELPMWRLAPSQPRRRCFSDDSPPAPGETLAPRALMLTALLRMGACDLFIHGAGGAIYDKATERWIERWLGVHLAPTAVVSADLLLPLHERDATRADLDRALWQAHRARHDPALLNDADAAREKAAALAEIRGGHADAGARLHAYRRMHAALAEYRSRHDAALRTMDEEAGRLRTLLAEAAIARDRAWPFPLHPRAGLEALRDAVLAAFEPARAAGEGHAGALS